MNALLLSATAALPPKIIASAATQTSMRSSTCRAPAAPVCSPLRRRTWARARHDRHSRYGRRWRASPPGALPNHPVTGQCASDTLRLPLSRISAATVYRVRQAREDAGIKPRHDHPRHPRPARRAATVRPDFTVPADVLPPENLTRVRVPIREDEAGVFPKLETPFQPIARLAALTLTRLSDVRTLERGMVHLKLGVILLPKTKTTPRPVPLSDAAIAILTAQFAALPVEARYVFPPAHRASLLAPHDLPRLDARRARRPPQGLQLPRSDAPRRQSPPRTGRTTPP